VNGGKKKRAGLRNSAALILSLLLHTAGMLTALLIHLHDPPSADRRIELGILPSPEPRTAPQQTDSGPEATARKTHLQQRRISVPAPQTPQLPDIPEREPEEERRDPTVIEIPSSPLEKEMTPEEAWSELGQLLEKHPEFREMVVREMLAGSGFAPDTLPKISLYLEQMIGGRFDRSWLQNRSAIEHAFRSYDGVHGWRQNSNYGNQVNVLGLLRFLIDLIEGDDE